MSRAPRPLELTERTFENGARLCCAPLPHLGRAHVGVTLRSGPLHESDRTWGLSHLVEHMVYRGTASHADARAVSEAADAFGGEIDGSTFRDRALYDTRVDPDRIGDAVTLLGEMLTAPRFDGLATERGILREELLETLDDDGQEIDADNLAMRDLFGGRPLARSIDGTLHTLDSFSDDDVRAFFEAGYAANHMVIVAAGRIDPALVEEEVGRVFGALPAGPAAQAPLGHGKPPPEDRVRVVRTDDSQTELRLVFETPGLHSAERLGLGALARLLDDGPATRIPGRLIDEQGLAYDLGASLSLYEEAGVLEVGAQVQHDRVAVVLAGVVKELRRLVDEPIGAAELDRVKARVRRDLDDLSDCPEEVVESLSRARLFGLSYDLRAQDEAFQALEAERLGALAGEILLGGRARLTLVGLPSKKQVKAAREALRLLEDGP